MKEYKVVEAKGAAKAEAVMNELARDGWEVVNVTYWTNWTTRLVITFSRGKNLTPRRKSV